MVLGLSNEGTGGRSFVRLALLVVAFLTVLSLPGLYYATIASHGIEMSHVLRELNLNSASLTVPPNQDLDGMSSLYGSGIGLVPQTLDSNRSLVTVVVCTKSKNNWRFVNETSLHGILIPSVEKTVTVREIKKYRLEFVVAFDEGDTFWEKTANRQEVADESIFPISFLSIPKNPKRPFQIPFNQLCRAAYDYGADYIVRVNDDSEFKTMNWMSQSIGRLSRFRPPNLGVVGPTCRQGNTQVRKRFGRRDFQIPSCQQLCGVN